MEDERVPFEKMQRDHLAKQSFMKESITDALSKQKGGNCVQSYARIAKVAIACVSLFFLNWRCTITPTYQPN
jgi:hypothetical protein